MDQKQPNTSSPSLKGAKNLEDYKTRATESISRVIAEKIISENEHLIEDDNKVIQAFKQFIHSVKLYFKTKLITWVLKSHVILSNETKVEKARDTQINAQSLQAQAKRLANRVQLDRALTHQKEEKIKAKKIEGASETELNELHVELKILQEAAVLSQLKASAAQINTAIAGEELDKNKMAIAKHALKKAVAKEKAADPDDLLEAQKQTNQAKKEYQLAKSQVLMAQQKIQVAKQQYILTSLDIAEANLAQTISQEKLALTPLDKKVAESQVVQSKLHLAKTKLNLALVEKEITLIESASKTAANPDQLEKAKQKLVEVDQRLHTARNEALSALRNQTTMLENSALMRLKQAKEAFSMADKQLSNAELDTMMQSIENAEDALKKITKAASETTLAFSTDRLIESHLDVGLSDLAMENANPILAKINTTVAKAKVDILKLSPFNVPDNLASDALEYLAEKLGILEIVERLGEHGEVLFLYVIDQLTKEMGAILDKSSKERVQNLEMLKINKKASIENENEALHKVVQTSISMHAATTYQSMSQDQLAQARTPKEIDKATRQLHKAETELADANRVNHTLRGQLAAAKIERLFYEEAELVDQEKTAISEEDYFKNKFKKAEAKVDELDDSTLAKYKADLIKAKGALAHIKRDLYALRQDRKVALKEIEEANKALMQVDSQITIKAPPILPASDEKTESNLQQEVKKLAKVLRDFTNPSINANHSPQTASRESFLISAENREAIKNGALSTVISPLLYLMEKQGDANSVTDVITPLTQTFFPLLRHWINPLNR